MSLRDYFEKAKYRPKPGEARTEFIARMARDGLPFLGAAETLRSPVWELCREVTELRAEVTVLRQQLTALQGG